MPKEIKEFYFDHQKPGAYPELTDYSRLLHLTADRFSKTFLIIDALDECKEDTRYNLLRDIRKLPLNVHLLCTSRYMPDIEQQLYNCARQEIRARNKDVESYISGIIEQNIRLRNHVIADSSLRDAVIRTIVANIDGML
jgi:hypothetical protein